MLILQIEFFCTSRSPPEQQAQRYNRYGTLVATTCAALALAFFSNSSVSQVRLEVLSTPPFRPFFPPPPFLLSSMLIFRLPLAIAKLESFSALSGSEDSVPLVSLLEGNGKALKDLE